jgi:hypothetical protein
VADISEYSVGWQDDWWTVGDLEGCGRGFIQILLPQYFPGLVQQNYEPHSNQDPLQYVHGDTVTINRSYAVISMRMSLNDAVTYPGLRLYSVGDQTNEYKALQNDIWQRKTAIFGEKPAPVPFSPPQIPRKLDWHWAPGLRNKKPWTRRLRVFPVTYREQKPKGQQ